MVVYRLAPEPIFDMYIACVREHNRPEVTPQVRYEEEIRSTAILDVVRVIWGNVAAGDILIRADNASEHLGDGRPMCGGMLMDLERAQ